jgi:hypothetical protein
LSIVVRILVVVVVPATLGPRSATTAPCGIPRIDVLDDFADAFVIPLRRRSQPASHPIDLVCLSGSGDERVRPVNELTVLADRFEEAAWAGA